MIYSNSPLNLNLIIPFKDNKGGSQKLYRNDLAKFCTELDLRVDDLKSGLAERFGAKLKVAISSRSDGGVKRYYWRFTSKSKKRTFNRLYDEVVFEYLGSNFDREEVISLKAVEEELIYINANLKVIKSIENAISKLEDESTKLIKMKSPAK